MTLGSDNPFPSVLFAEGTAAPTTPATGFWRLYTKSDGLYIVDDAGASTGPFTSAAGAGVATDAIWTAAGQIVYATGTATGTVLAIGTPTQVLTVSAGTALSWATPSASGGVSTCLAARTTTQSVSADPTAIAFNATDIYDPDGWHDPATNNTRLTCPTGKGGKMFMLAASVEFAPGSGVAYIRFRKNGTTVIGQTAITNNDYTGTSAAPVYLADGDYVECLLTNQTTGTIVVSDAPCTFGVMG